MFYTTSSILNWKRRKRSLKFNIRMFNTMIQNVSSERACGLLNLLAKFTTFVIWTMICLILVITQANQYLHREMELAEEDLLRINWEIQTTFSSFSGSRSSTFSNAHSSHKFKHIRINFQGLFFLTRIGLLTRSWHSWRLYASQRVVKTRLKEVAR